MSGTTGVIAIYLVNSDEMRGLDQRAQEMGIPSLVLMENAGRALADRACLMVRKGSRILVAVGPGQNGGDGLCAARHLSSRGFQVDVLLAANREKLTKESSANLHMLSGFPVRIAELNGNLESAIAYLGTPDLVVDALLGIGIKGDPRPPLDDAIRWINSLPCPILACDLPSGLDSDTGYPHNPCVRATATVTMGFPKVGLLSYPGAMYAGEVIVEGLGMQPSILETRTAVKSATLEMANRIFPRRSEDAHKGTCGHVTVIAGSKGMAGAAVLSATAALRAGAGTVTLLCPEGVYQVCASMVPEVMVVPVCNGDVFAPKREALEVVRSYAARSRAVVLGPGIGQGFDQKEFVEETIELLSNCTALVDADALNALAAGDGLDFLARREGDFILTPHPGELSRLLGIDSSRICNNRVGSALEAARLSRSVVCLKGAGTVTSEPSGEAVINTTGNSAMATAGSGDVLSGVIAGLVAQGLKPFDAAWLGVFWHGLAGEIAYSKAGEAGILSGEIAHALPEARAVILGRCKWSFRGPRPNWAK